MKTAFYPAAAGLLLLLAQGAQAAPSFSAEMVRDQNNYCLLYVTNHDSRQITCRAFGATFHISPNSREMGYGVPSGGGACPTHVPVQCEYFKNHFEDDAGRYRR